MKFRVVACAVLLLAAGALSVSAQTDGCAPKPAGADATVFFQRAKADCPSTAFPRAEDVPQIVTDTGTAPDGYVLATSITRDNDGAELLVLVKPWSLENYVIALSVTRVAMDTKFDGNSWRWTTPPADAGQ